MSEIDRAQWGHLKTSGEPVETRTQVTPNCIDVEAIDGGTMVSVYHREDGVEIHAGVLELIAKRGHVVLLQRHPPYPIERWTILWEGDVA